MDILETSINVLNEHYNGLDFIVGKRDLQYYEIRSIKNKKVLASGEYDSLQRFISANKDKLASADFSGMDLQEINFTKANLKGADFTRANLQGCCFWRADLTKAILTQACLLEIDLFEAKVINTKF